VVQRLINITEIQKNKAPHKAPLNKDNSPENTGVAKLLTRTDKSRRVKRISRKAVRFASL